MTVQEELMREIIEILKGFTIVGAVMVFCVYCLFVGVALFLIVNEKKKHKKIPQTEPPAVNEIDEDNHLQTQ